MYADFALALIPDRLGGGFNERASRAAIPASIRSSISAASANSRPSLVVEHGTLLLDGLYFALEPGSSNRGEVDYRALLAGRPQVLAHNPDGCYQLLREGHAVASRNILAAIYDSLRLCNTL